MAERTLETTPRRAAKGSSELHHRGGTALGLGEQTNTRLLISDL